MPNYDLTKLLPHNHPMILIDDVTEVNMKDQTLKAVFTPKKNMLFAEKEGVSTICCIEFMAQTVGCYAYFKAGMNKPVYGMLLGSRLLNIRNRYFEFGVEYTVSVREVFTDGEIVVFDCFIYDNNKEEISSATINVYQGAKMKELMINGR